MKKVIFTVFLVIVVAIAAAAPVSAEEYSRDYPPIGNSGSPVWLHCEVEGRGEYVIVIDPNVDLQSFGFDSPTGYNLINNTASTITGRAYSVRYSTGYAARWLSFYKLQLRTGDTGMDGQRAWEDYNITAIYGTTLDLVDYVGGRQNDYYSGLRPEFRAEFIIHLATGLISIVIGALLFFRRRRV